MRKQIGLAAVSVVLFAGKVTAQTTVTTSGGTAATVPVFTGNATLGNSPISISTSNGNVGIGTNAPFTPLTIMGVSGQTSITPIYGGRNGATATSAVTFGKQPFLELVGDGTENGDGNIGLLQLNIGSVPDSAAELYLAATRAMAAAAAGTVPVANRDILGRIGFYGDDGASVRVRGAVIDSEVDTAQSAVSSFGTVPAVLNLGTTGLAPIVFYTNLGGGNSGPYFGSSTEKMRIDYNGNVGIGATTPTYKLDVAGQIRSSSGGVVFPDGSVQTTAYTQVASGTNVITQSGGNVGIGTTSPGAKLEVDGSLKLTAGSGGGITFADGTA